VRLFATTVVYRLVTYPTASVLTLVGYVALVALSVPGGFVGAALARRVAPRRVAVGVLAVLGLATLAAIVWQQLSFGVEPPVLVELLVAWLAVVVGPVVFAAGAAARLGPAPRDRAWRLGLAAWPVGTVASTAVFFAPGPFLRINVTFLTGTDAAVWIGGLLLVLWGVPTLVATVLVNRDGEDT